MVRDAGFLVGRALSNGRLAVAPGRVAGFVFGRALSTGRLAAAPGRVVGFAAGRVGLLVLGRVVVEGRTASRGLLRSPLMGRLVVVFRDGRLGW